MNTMSAGWTHTIPEDIYKTSGNAAVNEPSDEERAVSKVCAAEQTGNLGMDGQPAPG